MGSILSKNHEPIRNLSPSQDTESFFVGPAPQVWGTAKEYLNRPSREKRGNVFDPFTDARAFVRGLNIPNYRAWRVYASTDRPPYIPSCPNEVYSEWAGYDDWLGTEKEGFLPFPDARDFVHALQLANQYEYRDHVRSLERRCVPVHPHRVYRDKGWNGWADWLGKPGFLPFEEARAIVRKLGLKSQLEWRAWARTKPQNIPFNPQESYRDEWCGLNDWLGLRQERFLPFVEARDYARSLRIQSVRLWKLWCKTSRPPTIPANPTNYYKHTGWINWPDWLGTDQFYVLRDCTGQFSPNQER